MDLAEIIFEQFSHELVSDHVQPLPATLRLAVIDAAL
jgi:hypothetical protein